MMMSMRDLSSLQEKSVAKYLGWRVVPNSGATGFLKGDIVSNSWIGECKTKAKSQDTIMFERVWWKKLLSESISPSKSPVLITDAGTLDEDTTWCLIPSSCVPPTYPIVELHDHLQFKCGVNVRLPFRETFRLFRKLPTGTGCRFVWNMEPVVLFTLEGFRVFINGGELC